MCCNRTSSPVVPLRSSMKRQKRCWRDAHVHSVATSGRIDFQIFPTIILLKVHVRSLAQKVMQHVLYLQNLSEKCWTHGYELCFRCWTSNARLLFLLCQNIGHLELPLWDKSQFRWSTWQTTCISGLQLHCTAATGQTLTNYASRKWLLTTSTIWLRLQPDVK